MDKFVNTSAIEDSFSLVALISVALLDISLINFLKFIIALFKAFAKISSSSFVSISIVFDKSFSPRDSATDTTFLNYLEIPIAIIKPNVIEINNPIK